jgi:hypothetical protein
MQRSTCRAMVLLALTALGASLGPSPAHAVFACTVMPSPDGFVALRDAPSVKGKLVTRATPGHVVIILQKPNGDPVSSGSWHRVLYYPGEAMPEKTDPAYKQVREGWMHKSFVNECG